jgi:hypothetical protein
MSLENLEVIDVVSIDLKGRVVLTIADHLEWNDSNHLFLLQSKINRYLDAIANGSLYASYPDAVGRNVVINIAAKYSPNTEGQTYLNEVERILNSAGYDLNFSVIKD